MKKFIFGFLIPILIVVIILLFTIDVGIYSKYFIERDFNNAFVYRATGNCEAFLEYIIQGRGEWQERCEKEKSRENEPIREFKVQNVSHKFGSNKAFLQVELSRNIGEKEDYEYSATYEMIKENYRWKINQELK